MRLDELTRPSDRAKAEKVLANAGYKKYGSGSYGSVWGKEGSSQVLKLFDGHDNAYYDFIMFCQKHNNPHLPKFFSKPIKVTPLYKAIKTELLTPAAIPSSAAECLDDYARLRMRYKTDDGIKKSLGKHYQEALQSGLPYLKDPEFKAALDAIIDDLIIKQGHMSDIHPTNFMERNGVLVFTDPIN